MSNFLNLRYPEILNFDVERLLYEQRFWEHTAPEPNTGCLLWTGSLKWDGYGELKAHRRRRSILAHRLAWELTHGEIPKGLCVCHTCDVKACVNPEHLFLGTSAENTADMVAKNRQAKGSRCARAKLNEAAIPEIRALREQGWSQQKIADKVGIHQTQISKILLGKTWGHVDSAQGVSP